MREREREKNYIQLFFYDTVRTAYANGIHNKTNCTNEIIHSKKKFK
jgi:hypothetical protein